MTNLKYLIFSTFSFVAVSCSTEKGSDAKIHATSELSINNDAIQLVPPQKESFAADLNAFSLEPSDAWSKLITSGEMRGTTEISTTPNMQWSLQKYKVVVRPMPVKFDVEIVLNSPGSNGNSTILFQDTIKKILDATNKNKSVLVKVNSGTYRFTSLTPNIRDRKPAIAFADISRVKITGSNPLDPPKFIFTNPYGEGISIENCRLLEVSNIKIDYEYPASYGKVAYVGKSLGNGDIQSDDLFNSSSVGGLQNPLDIIGAVFSFNSKLKTWFSGTSANHITFEASDQPVKKNANTFSDPRLSVISAGEEVMILHTRAGFTHAILAKGRANQDIILRAIKINSYPQMGVVLSGGRGFWLDGVVIEPAAGKFVSGRADGIHIAGVQGDVIVENCKVSGQGDDGLNIHGTAYSITHLADTGVIRIMGPTVPEIGDRLALLSIGNRPLYTAVIQDFSKIETNHYAIKLDWGNCDAACRQKLFIANEMDSTFSALARKGDVDRIGIAYTVNLSSSRYLIRNNKFFESGARGIIVEAPNGTVDNNTIQRVPDSGIAIISSNSYYLSGLGAVNVRISSNSISDSAFSKVLPRFPLEGAISIMTPGPADAFPLLQSLMIRDNTVNRVGLAFGSVLRGTNILFKGNRAAGFGLNVKPGVKNERLILRSKAGVTNLDR